MGLLPDIAASLGITEPTAGHVISAYALGVVIGAPLIARLAARMNRKTLLLALMAVFTLGNLASVLAPSYGTLMAARFVAGLPHGAFFGVAALVAAHLMGRGNRAKAVAHVMTGLTVATVLGVPMASWLGQALGWRSAFGLVVAVGVDHADRDLVLAAHTAVDARHQSAHRTRRAAARAGVAGTARRNDRLRRDVRRVHLHQHDDDRRRRTAPRPGPVGAHGLRRRHGGRQPRRRPDGRQVGDPRTLCVDRRAGRRARGVRARRSQPVDGAGGAVRHRRGRFRGGTGPADPADGRRARRADVGGGPEPLRAQHRQCDRRLGRRRWSSRPDTATPLPPRPARCWPPPDLSSSPFPCCCSAPAGSHRPHNAFQLDGHPVERFDAARGPAHRDRAFHGGDDEGGDLFGVSAGGPVVPQ